MLSVCFVQVNRFFAICLGEYMLSLCFVQVNRFFALCLGAYAVFVLCSGE